MIKKIFRRLVANTILVIFLLIWFWALECLLPVKWYVVLLLNYCRVMILIGGLFSDIKLIAQLVTLTIQLVNKK